MIDENSRYVETALYNRMNEDTPILKHRKRFTFDKDLATTYQWKEGDTLDGIALAFYENSHLRWAILDANPQYRSEYLINVGDIIYIPDYDEILDILDE